MTEKTDENKETKVVGILSSPENPVTLSRQSSTGEISWHKRVIVHSVPRNDGSRYQNCLIVTKNLQI